MPMNALKRGTCATNTVIKRFAFGSAATAGLVVYLDFPIYKCWPGVLAGAWVFQRIVTWSAEPG